MKNAIRNAIASTRSFFARWQEFTLWLPGMVALAVLGYIVLGGIARVGPDALAWLAELPAMCAYAVAWIGFAWLIQHLYMRDFSREEERELHEAAREGEEGARWLIVKARIEIFAALLLSLVFFWPAR